jgi:hypothetical protein
MLKTIDIFIGLALIMLLVSMIVTVITQIATHILNSRGKYLLRGVADMLEQLNPGIDREIAEEIADVALRNPLVSDANGRLGNVIHREELIKLLLELGAGDGANRLSERARQSLERALVEDGICQDGTPDQIRGQIRAKLKNVCSFALQLELARPDLTNAARARVAVIQQANSQFVAKIHLWFDQTMDRASERFTAHTRYVTFLAAFAVALFLQLDTAALVSRLSTDADLRTSLLRIAERQTSAAGIPATNAPAAAAAPAASGQPTDPIQLTDIDRQNLKDLVVNNVIGIPQSWSDWVGRWHADNFVMKILGLLLTTFLLSLGAPFWYGALQNLVRLRSLLATKDDEQREQRQVSGPGGTSTDAETVVFTDERGDLAATA